MIRIILQNIILLLLPTVLYFSYMYLRRGGNRQDKAGNTTNVVDGAPLVLLFSIGAVLALGTMLYFVSFEQGQPGQNYTPPELRDGKIIREKFN